MLPDLFSKLCWFDNPDIAGLKEYRPPDENLEVGLMRLRSWLEFLTHCARIKNIPQYFTPRSGLKIDMPNIRAARASDSHSINQLSQLFGYPQDPDELASVRLNQLIDSDSDKVWVFEQHNQVLGWIHLFIAKRLASANFVEIGGLVVSNDFRRQGIGRQLVERANGWAREMQLSLRVRCNAKRDGSCNFYRAINFSELKNQLVFEADSVELM